ncbi:hypothetical protein [Parachlamydia acanthamoebae]|uniref:hypothetical protein n=1 Tax=Parachlamydia acanthamoebae TaxID=83552 RepID=UPI000AF25EDD|nr:hypothetical protein [Parachlamydia acanthamoebae]
MLRVWLTTGLVILHTFLHAIPNKVLLMRHAEKPLEGICLNLKGLERAAALIPYFQGRSEIQQYGTPVVIFALKPGPENGSVRSIQTVAPLAHAMGIQLNTDFEDPQYPKMIEWIKTHPGFQDKTVLICWEHHVLPDMAKQFGASTVPATWEGDVFDRVWVLDLSQEEVIFTDIPQRLLFGDSSAGAS